MSVSEKLDLVLDENVKEFSFVSKLFIQNEFEVKFSPDIAEQGFSIWISDSFLKHFFVVLTSLRFVQESHFSLIQLLHLMCEPFRLESTFQQINYTWMTTIPKIYNVLHME